MVEQATVGPGFGCWGALVRLLRIFAIALGLAAAPALAQPAPIIAPIPEWVEKVAVPAAAPAEAGKPIQVLLLTAQSRYGEPSEHFVESATRIQTAQGLNGLGTIRLPWQPDRGDLIVHKVHILREGQVIDLLADGQTFTVLRRENNLEAAMLDESSPRSFRPKGLPWATCSTSLSRFGKRKGLWHFAARTAFSSRPNSPSERSDTGKSGPRPHR